MTKEKLLKGEFSSITKSYQIGLQCHVCTNLYTIYVFIFSDVRSLTHPSCQGCQLVRLYIYGW